MIDFSKYNWEGDFMASDLGYCEHDCKENFSVGVYSLKYNQNKILHINLHKNEIIDDFELEQEE